MQKIIQKTKAYILIFLLATVLAIGIFVSNRNNPTTTKPLDNARFVYMFQVDQDRIKEIVTGVAEDTTPATKEMKQELKTIFAKYNMTDEEIGYFKTFGSGFIWPNYDTLFFIDALESFKSGVPVKSEARRNLEELGLTFKTMTTDMIKNSDQEIEKIAKKEPALSPPQILIESKIKGLLNYSKTRLLRVDTLFVE